ncbi:tyrosinase [Ceratobasidium sp. AG-Ba]|nr:tyrosinase [Ceratobasidium sp. AG-Ba]QRW11717.1 tyrosinase [Ceratobasidium sp. AG-Ba]
MADSWAPYQITGAVVSSSKSDTFTPPPLRRDICDLKDGHKHQFTLYIKALEKIMQPGFQPEAASFQGIGGIHGMPYSPWSGDPDEVRQTKRGPFLGYCNHGSILFPTWHRPHLLLLEQSISDAAIGIAGDFVVQVQDLEERKRWLEAAEDLRLPFWDWTHPRTGETGIPEFFTTPKITLYMPSGQEEEHNNPLYSYRFVSQVNGFDNRYHGNRIYQKPGRAYFKEWDRTYRNPDSRPHDVTENYAEVNERLKSKKKTFDVGDHTLNWQAGSWAQLTNLVSQMFAFKTDIEEKFWANVWDEFSNTTVQSAPARGDHNQPIRRWPLATSLEASHNQVHVTVGGIGHMSDNDTAGFDPIFYLHHCNVDRLLSFWQHIYPDYLAGTKGYFDEKEGTRKDFTQRDGTWMQLSDVKIDEDSPLLPFRDGDYNYWTSKNAYTLKYFDPKNPKANSKTLKYYTYPPIVVESGGKPYYININTNPSVEVPVDQRNLERRLLQEHFQYDPRVAREQAPKMVLGLFADEAPYNPERAKIDVLREPLDNFRQFFVSISLDPSFCEGSYSAVVSFKIPAPITQPDREEEVHEFGQVTALSRGRSDLCGNCISKKAAGARVNGSVLVPHELVAVALHNLGLNDPETQPEQAVAAVKSCLQASVRLPSGAIYASLSDSGKGAKETELSHHGAPILELLSCDVYVKRETPRPDPKDRADEDPKQFDHLPFNFDDWKPHGLLTTTDEKPSDSTTKLGWYLS